MGVVRLYCLFGVMATIAPELKMAASTTRRDVPGATYGKLAQRGERGAGGGVTSGTRDGVARSNATGRGERGVIRYKTCLRNTIGDVLRARGWQEVKEGEEWDFYWCDVTWMREHFDQIYLEEHQRVCHFRNHYELTR